ncbi:MAG: GyrI-like domain-containing protein [Ruminococcaceae bacterium]|nr:GyrI-like domain-containing protein [Oscillospiraceae bacterium]
MIIDTVVKESFCVIGLQGSTDDGEGFVQRLWAEANARFGEVSHLALRDGDGCPVGVWGAMSDFSMSFAPWEEGFSRGLYLAGVECAGDALPPEGWTKWSIPGFEYLRVKCDGSDVFSAMLAHLEENGLSLAGAVQDFTCPKTGESFMLFPVGRLIPNKVAN